LNCRPCSSMPHPHCTHTLLHPSQAGTPALCLRLPFHSHLANANGQTRGRYRYGSPTTSTHARAFATVKDVPYQVGPTAGTTRFAAIHLHFWLTLRTHAHTPRTVCSCGTPHAHRTARTHTHLPRHVTRTPRYHAHARATPLQHRLRTGYTAFTDTAAYLRFAHGSDCSLLFCCAGCYAAPHHRYVWDYCPTCAPPPPFSAQPTLPPLPGNTHTLLVPATSSTTFTPHTPHMATLDLPTTPTHTTLVLSPTCTPIPQPTTRVSYTLRYATYRAL